MRSSLLCLFDDKLTSRGSEVSTTCDESMNHVVGKSHLSFKLVLDGTSLISNYGAHEYDDRGYVGNEMVSHNEREVRIETNTIHAFNAKITSGAIMDSKSVRDPSLRLFIFLMLRKTASSFFNLISATLFRIDKSFRLISAAHIHSPHCAFVFLQRVNQNTHLKISYPIQIATRMLLSPMNV